MRPSYYINNQGPIGNGYHLILRLYSESTNAQILNPKPRASRIS